MASGEAAAAAAAVAPESGGAPIKAANGTDYYAIDVKDASGAQTATFFEDSETHATNVAVAEIAAKMGIPFFRIMAVGDVPPPEVVAEDEARKYVAKCLGNYKACLDARDGSGSEHDEEVIKMIKSGNTSKFVSALANDQGLATRTLDQISGTRAIHIAAYYVPAIEILSVLVAREDIGQVVDSESASGRTPLAYAISAANAAAVRVLIANPHCTQRTFSRAINHPIPPYIEGLSVQKGAVDALKEIYGLLPECRGSWDPRWGVMFERMFKDAPEAALASHETLPLPAVAAAAQTSVSKAGGASNAMDCSSEPCHPESSSQSSSSLSMAVEETAAEIEHDQPQLCAICMAAPADTIAIPCGHCVACSACSLKMVGGPNTAKCIICRSHIDGVFSHATDSMQ